VAFLEVEVAKWRATTQTVWRMERPKVANATVTFIEVVRSNCQLSSKFSDVLAKLLCTKLDGGEMFGPYKDLLKEKNDLAGKVDNTVAEKEELAKVVADLEARLKESESRLEESELRVSKERETNKELKDELLMFKKEVAEQHKKGFYKAVRQVGFFAEDLGSF